MYLGGNRHWVPLTFYKLTCINKQMNTFKAVSKSRIMKWGESTEVCTPMEPLTEVIVSYEYHCTHKSLNKKLSDRNLNNDIFSLRFFFLFNIYLSDNAQLAYHKADTVLLKADIQNWQAALPIGGWGGVGQGKQAANILDYLSN